MNKLTYDQVCTLLGKNEDRVLKVAGRLGFRPHRFSTWATACQHIADHTLTVPSLDQSTLIVQLGRECDADWDGVPAMPPGKIRGVYGLSLFDTGKAR